MTTVFGYPVEGWMLFALYGLGVLILGAWVNTAIRHAIGAAFSEDAIRSRVRIAVMEANALYPQCRYMPEGAVQVSSGFCVVAGSTIWTGGDGCPLYADEPLLPAKVEHRPNPKETT